MCWAIFLPVSSSVFTFSFFRMRLREGFPFFGIFLSFGTEDAHFFTVSHLSSSRVTPVLSSLTGTLLPPPLPFCLSHFFKQLHILVMVAMICFVMFFSNMTSRSLSPSLHPGTCPDWKIPVTEIWKPRGLKAFPLHWNVLLSVRAPPGPQNGPLELLLLLTYSPTPPTIISNNLSIHLSRPASLSMWVSPAL